MVRSKSLLSKILLCGGCLTVCATLLSSCGEKSESGSAAAPPPTAVTVVTLQEQDVNLSAELPARIVAVRSAEVRPQVSGIIQKRLFQEGGIVHAGQQLYQIDDARYKAELKTAEAQLSQAKANYTSVKAQYDRFQGLIRQKAVSQQDFDNVLNSYEQAKAAVAVSEAALQTARINLDYTQVIAPIDGRIGKSAVTEGALVTAQQVQALATIHQLDPVHVDMSQSAKTMLSLRQQLLDGRLNQDEAPEVQLILENGETYAHKGALQFSEMSVDSSTGAVTLRAVVPNPDQLLLPGMFVRAELTEGNRRKALLVPQRGVQRDREGNSHVLVVAANNTVERRMIMVSRAIGSDWLVEAGLRAGDKVIVEGLQKIRPGAPVNATELSADPAEASGDDGESGNGKKEA